jgi:hypothetical protein
MDAVLDGKPPDEVRGWIGCGRPTRRAQQFATHRRQPFDGLEGIAMAVPPADLVAAVMDCVPAPGVLERVPQLWQSRVYLGNHHAYSGSRLGISKGPSGVPARAIIQG